MNYLPSTAHLFGGKLNRFVVMTSSLLVKGSIVLLAGLIGLAWTSSRHGTSTTLLFRCHLFRRWLVPMQTTLTDLPATQRSALLTLVFLRLTGGTGAFELLVQELARVVLDGVAELNFGVEEAEAVFVEGGSLEGGAGGGGGFGHGGLVVAGGSGVGVCILDDGGGVGGLRLFGYGGSGCYFAHFDLDHSGIDE